MTYRLPSSARSYKSSYFSLDLQEKVLAEYRGSKTINQLIAVNCDKQSKSSPRGLTLSFPLLSPGALFLGGPHPVLFLKLLWNSLMLIQNFRMNFKVRRAHIAFKEA